MKKNNKTLLICFILLIISCFVAIGVTLWLVLLSDNEYAKDGATSLTVAVDKTDIPEEPFAQPEPMKWAYLSYEL